jgi:hypothetical protein
LALRSFVGLVIPREGGGGCCGSSGGDGALNLRLKLMLNTPFLIHPPIPPPLLRAKQPRLQARDPSPNSSLQGYYSQSGSDRQINKTNLPLYLTPSNKPTYPTALA